MTLTHGSLFSGIGGFDLGFERAGFKTIWQVEIDPYCRKVLEKHFPHAKRFDDIHDVVRWHPLDWVDVISGGFPCQDISQAGKRAGIDGERSGLWSEMWRVIRAMAPRFVVVENVAALLGRGMERVLGDLASGGYDAEWDVLPAATFGAPHIRERVFILAYPNSVRNNSRINGDGENGKALGCEARQSAGMGCQTNVADSKRFAGQVRAAKGERLGRSSSGGEDVADTAGTRYTSRTCAAGTESVEAGRIPESDGRSTDVAYASSAGLEKRESITGNDGKEFAAVERSGSGAGDVPDSEKSDGTAMSSGIAPQACYWWAVEPDVGRVAHGVPHRVDRLKGLGNAVVPQIAEWIAWRIRTLIDQ